MSVTSHHSDSIHTLARNGRIPYSRVLRGPHLSDALKLLGSAWLETLGLTIVLVRVVIRSQAPRMVTFYFAHNPVLLSSGAAVFHRIHNFHKERKKKQKRKKAAAPTKYSVRTNRALNTYKVIVCICRLRIWSSRHSKTLRRPDRILLLPQPVNLCCYAALPHKRTY